MGFVIVPFLFRSAAPKLPFMIILFIAKTITVGGVYMQKIFADLNSKNLIK